MPWKSTKLKFCGIPLRRRTLYLVTLVCAITAVPTLSWALLTLGGKFTPGEIIGFFAAAVISLALALNGWRIILKRKITLFFEEARLIWPGSACLLVAATWLGCVVANTVIHRGRLDYIVPSAFGGIMFIFLAYRCATLGSHPKRGAIVRGDSRRSHSQSGLPSAPLAEEELAEPAMEDDDIGPEPPLDGSVS